MIDLLICKETMEKLRYDWHLLAIAFNTGYKTVTKINDDWRLHRITEREILQLLLLEWKSRLDRKATLTKLVDVLLNGDCNIYAEKLLSFLEDTISDSKDGKELKVSKIVHYRKHKDNFGNEKLDEVDFSKSKLDESASDFLVPSDQFNPERPFRNFPINVDQISSRSSNRKLVSLCMSRRLITCTCVLTAWFAVILVWVRCFI